MSKTPQAFDSLTSLRLHGTLILSLAPVAVVATFSGGWSVAFVILTTMLVAWVTDFLLRRSSSLRERDDGSSLLWGLCLSLLMPPAVPFWIPWAGVLFSLLVIKTLMGGSGSPWLNPVLIAWAFCQTCWPSEMGLGRAISGAGSAQISGFLLEHQSTFDRSFTEWLNSNVLSWINIQLPGGYIDLISGLGNGVHSWNAEAGATLLLASTVFLLVRGTIPWQIPSFFFVGFAVPMAVLGGLPSGAGLFAGDVLFQVFSGTFLLGIFFLATDTSSRPLSESGLALFGLGAGILTFSLRTWGAHPEGVGYAILLMNLLVPWIDTALKKKVLNDFR